MSHTCKITAFALTAAMSLLSTSASMAQQANERKAIVSDKAPKPSGAYSAALSVGNMVFLAGQLPIVPGATESVNKGTIEEQTKQVMENLNALLEAGGMTMANVVQTTIYMKDLNEFSKMNNVYGSYFKENPPARATIEAARLPRDVAIEISAIAVR